MEIFNSYVIPETIEALDQMIQKMNAASGGSIVLSSATFDGDFNQRSFFAGLDGAQRRVDRYAALGAASVTDLTQGKESHVKIAGGFGPVRYEPSQLTWLRINQARGIAIASQKFAELLLKDQLNTAIGAAKAAIVNNSLEVDVSATAGVTYGGMNSAHALFGDQSDNIVAHVMTGQAFHAFIGDNISNANRLFTAGNVQVVDVLGRIVVVTDAPQLYVSGTPNKTTVLGLVSNGVKVSDTSDIIANVQTNNGQTRIYTTIQMDYTFGLGLEGYTWDETNGGPSPDDSDLFTGTNWDQSATYAKHTAGVALTADADQ